MRHGSLFSGIGGFDLAAEWMGWENVFHCEWNPFGQKILHHYWPNAKLFTDITKADFTKYANQIDILTGGFPCQPYSQAGKRLGKDDERHLWPEMLRAIKEIKPTWIVGENVRGLTNWNGGVVFNEVQTDLENCGYEVQALLLPACAVNAPHRRDRVWFVAYSISSRISISKFGESKTKQQVQTWCNIDGFKSMGTTTNSNSIRHERWCYKNGEERTISEQYVATLHPCKTRNSWKNFPTQPPICGGDDGLPTKLDGITFSKWRNESIKGYGNAVVPQLVYQIFKTIEQYDQENG